MKSTKTMSKLNLTMESLFLYGALFVALYAITKHFLHKFLNLPPSPTLSLPLLGHLYLVKDPLYRSLAQLAKRFGPILFLQFGSRPVLVVSCPEAIEDCLAKNDITLANRPRLLAGKSGGYNYTSITWAPYGDHWCNLRRISSLELLSSHRLQLLSSIHATGVKLLVKKLFRASINSEDGMIEMKSAFFELAMNNIMRMLVGDHVSETEQWRKYRDRVERSFRGGGSALVLEDYLPILRWFSGLESKFQKLHEVNDRFVQGIIDERRKMLNDEAALGGVKKATIDVLLSLQKNDPEYYSDEMIKGFLLSFSSAGTGTTAGTLEWALILLLNNPEVLEKAQNKIDEKVGHDRLLQESDIEHLPYLHCIIMETLRMYSAGPLAFHSSSADCKLGGYYVPKGTMVIANLWALHNDPNIWEEPEKFKTERFEGVEGNRVGFKIMPFGAGRRSCPGEGLAMCVLGLTLGSLLHCFEWERVSRELVDMKEGGGGGISLAKFDPLWAKCSPRQCMFKVVSGI